jgi:hypothetical protein
MPLLKGRPEIGHNIKEMEQAGHPKSQAVAAALREANVPKARDMAVTAPSAGAPSGMRRSAGGSASLNDGWRGRTV